MMSRSVSFAIMVLLALLCLPGCYPKITCTITGTHYDKARNNTSYTVLPYGSVSLPGEWVASKYFQPARQQWFTNKDSVSLSISFGPGNKFEFSKEGLNGFAFAKAYYDWEAKYESEHLRVKVKLVEADSINQYVIAKIYNDSANTIALYGGRECACKEGAFQHFTISGRKMNDDEMIRFLRDIFLKK